MKWLRIKAVFESETPLAGERVADIFFSAGINGVETGDGFDGDIPDQKASWVTGYLPCSETTDGILEKMRANGVSLEQSGIAVSFETDIIDDQDWLHSWKRFFHVSRITDSIVVRPSWLNYEKKSGDIVIEIDPGLAFGTGTHPSTVLCIRLIEKYLRPGGSFLDIGTGSGILVIAAEKLGAGKLVAVDNDISAVETAAGNIRKNGIAPYRCAVIAGTVDCLQENRFDTICVNISAETIKEIMPRIKSTLAPRGIAILSGILAQRSGGVKAALKESGLSAVHTEKEQEWAAIAAAPDPLLS